MCCPGVGPSKPLQVLLKEPLDAEIKSSLSASQSMWPDPCTNPQSCPSPYPRPSRTFPVLDWYHVFLPQPGPQVHRSVMVGTHILAHNWSLTEGHTLGDRMEQESPFVKASKNVSAVCGAGIKFFQSLPVSEGHTVGNPLGWNACAPD